MNTDYRLLDNLRRVDSIVSEWRSTDPKDSYIVKLQCFNKEEADQLSGYMKYRYPEVAFFTTWINFDGQAGS